MSGPKASYVLTFQLSSPDPSHEMMDSVGLAVDEIVYSRVSPLMYVYLHFHRKIREHELHECMKTLESTYGLKGSNLFGYETIFSNIPREFELIEDHPGFKTLVQHEAYRNENFHRWTAAGYSGVNCGYNLLKSRLHAKQATQTAFGAAGGSAAAGNTTGDDEAHAPESPPSGGGGHGIDAASDGEEQYSGDGGGGQSTGPSREGRHKRVRSVTPPPPSMRQRLDDDGGRIRNCEMFSVFRTMYEDSRLLRGELPDLREKVVAQKYELDRSAAELLVQRSKTADFEEQLRLAKREVSSHEGELNDLKAKVAGVDKTIGDLKEEHAAAIKAKDEEALTARKLLVDELDAMRLAKVVVYLVPCVCVY
jgi:hypothetical protein